MRKFGKGKIAATLAVAAFGAVLAIGLAGCGGSSPAPSGGSSASPDASAAPTSAAPAAPAAAEGSQTITVAAVPTPHAEILNDVCKPILAEQGYDLVVKEFTDYVLPNTATEEGEVDANYFQHKPYLDDFNKKQKTKVVSVAAIHNEPMGMYAGKLKALDGLKMLK